MHYSLETVNGLKAIAKRDSISLAEVTKLAESEMKRTGDPITNFTKYYATISVGGLIEGWNRANPSDNIVPGRAKTIQLSIIGLVVVAVAVGAFFAYKKFKK